jgi:hypothetical protein
MQTSSSSITNPTRQNIPTNSSVEKSTKNVCEVDLKRQEDIKDRNEEVWNYLEKAVKDLKKDDWMYRKNDNL